MVSKEYPRIGEKIYHAELPNGLHIYVDRRPEFQKSYAFCHQLRRHGYEVPPGRPVAGHPGGGGPLPGAQDVRY